MPFSWKILLAFPMSGRNLFLFQCNCIYLWRWVFIAAHGLSLVEASGATLLLQGRWTQKSWAQALLPHGVLDHLGRGFKPVSSVLKADS